MAKAFDYWQKIRDDLVEQFKGKKNIEILAGSFAAQLQEVYEFFLELSVLLDIAKCEGKQLDGIGSIVALSRYEARVLIGKSEKEVLDDANYRKMLKYKILLNTNTGTYWDIINGVKTFWDKGTIYYEEKPEEPATIFLSTSVLTPEQNAREFLESPIIKPAGVKLIRLATTETPVEPAKLHTGGMTDSVAITALPELEIKYVFHENLSVGAMVQAIMTTALSELEGG